jgi:DNA transformation protein
MSEKPSSIRNLGPVSDAFFGRAGITTADQLRALGADAAYLQALKVGGRPHFIGYYVLVMGLQGRPWNDCQGKEKVDTDGQRPFGIGKAFGSIGRG